MRAQLPLSSAAMIPSGSLPRYTWSALLLFCYSITAHSNLVTAPEIVDVQHKSEGQCYSITCTVKCGGLKEETMVYWLANNTFLERAFKRNRVMAKETISHGGSEFLQSELVFRRVLTKDYFTNFTCIALSPAGYDKKLIQVKPTFQKSRGCRTK